ncbi:MAG TPA: VOC family protein [Gemmatimonadota bacterium]|nr:VOC family protein [Gemmatimonadota bacterium]
MAMKKLTPVLLVEAIEPCLAFWTERLGFEVTGSVPEGEALGFAMLRRDAVEIMYQTRASMAGDVPALADRPAGGAFLFVEVDDIDAVEAALEGVETVVPRRTTFYGATEVSVLEPGGNVVTFAEFGREG